MATSVYLDYCALPDDDLTALAAGGDSRAATEFLTRNQSYLHAIARKLGWNRVEPDDLLAEALTNLLSKWADGSGPAENVKAYLIRSMRNRVIDEVRSPRSRVGALDPDEELIATADAEVQSVELHREFELVRRAFAKLPSDQRSVLTATVIEGRKPRDLERELGRRAPAIWSLARRATVSLRRQVLREVLEDEAPKECLAHTKWLPKEVPDDPDQAGRSRGMAHIKSCDRCRAAWAVFARMSSTLGVASLLVAAQSIGTRQQAVASQGVPQAASSVDERERRRDFARTWALRTGALAAVGVGVTLFAIATGSPAGEVIQQVSGTGPVARASTVMTAEIEGFTVAVDFDVAGKNWQITELALTAPSGAELAAFPEGWTCRQVAASTNCRTDQPNANGGTFRYHYSQPAAGASFRLSVKATTEGTPVEAVSLGPVLILPKDAKR